MLYTCNQDDVDVLFDEILDSSIFNYIIKIINLQIIFDNIIDEIFTNTTKFLVKPTTSMITFRYHKQLRLINCK